MRVKRRALDDRNQRVAHCVAADDDPLGDALEPRHLDVFGLEHIDHRGALKARQVGDHREHERQDRQCELLRVREGALAGRDERDRRQHLEDRCGEEDEQAEPDHELGQRRQDEDPDLRRVIELAISPDGAHGSDEKSRGIAITADSRTSAKDASPRSRRIVVTGSARRSSCRVSP